MYPNFLCLCVRVCVLSPVCVSVIPWAVAHQTPLSMPFPKQEYWSGLPFPPPGDLADSGIKPVSLASPALACAFFTSETLVHCSTIYNSQDKEAM